MITNHRIRIATIAVFLLLLVVPVTTAAYAGESTDPATTATDAAPDTTLPVDPPAEVTPPAPEPVASEPVAEAPAASEPAAAAPETTDTPAAEETPAEQPAAEAPSTTDTGNTDTGNQGNDPAPADPGPTGSTGGTGPTGSTGSTGPTGPSTGSDGDGGVVLPNPPGGNNGGTNPNTGTPSTGEGTNPPASQTPTTTPTSDGELGTGVSGGSQPGADATTGTPTAGGVSPEEAAQVAATLEAITKSPESLKSEAQKLADKREGGLAGVQGTFVVTKFVNHIPGWMRWALTGLTLLASLFGIFLLREFRARRSAEADAMVDALTGISNRKAFDRRLDLEWRRAARYGRSLGLMVMDLDGFKAVNDLQGHAAGDKVLREVAQRLDGRMRDTDLVARIGGDEFAVICPETGVNELMTIRRQLSDHATENLSNPVGLSVGVAEYVPGDEDAYSILARADESMYRVKRGESTSVAA